MQEEMNSAMAQLNETVGDDVPTLNEVEEKIQARYAKAKATSELNETSVESRVLEVEQATANVEAQSRLDASCAPSSASTPPAGGDRSRPRRADGAVGSPVRAVPDPARGPTGSRRRSSPPPR